MKYKESYLAQRQLQQLRTIEREVSISGSALEREGGKEKKDSDKAMLRCHVTELPHCVLYKQQ